MPEKFGYLTPLVPGATDMDAITLQPGCDVGQDSGLQNTATWSLDVVEPATREVLMKEVRQAAGWQLVGLGASRLAGVRRQRCDQAGRVTQG